MPIYAYRCASCGHAKDVLQKLSDPLLTTCPACGADAFRKQLTAAGFQLKGSGWYVTDFKGGAAKPEAAAADAAKPGEAAKPADAAKPAGDTAAPAAPTAPAASPAPAPSPSVDKSASGSTPAAQ